MLFEGGLIKTRFVSVFNLCLRKASTSNTKRSKKERYLKDIMSSKTDKEEKITICVEGNIASGKTSFLQYFKDTPHVEILEEPVKKWRNINGQNALAKMYEDQTRWSLTLQTYVQLTMLQNHLQPQNKEIKMMERSIYSAKYCFAENLHNIGKMPDIEYAVLSEWFDWIVSYHKLPLNLIVYLQTKPEIVYERIRKRNRPEEQSISLEYLQSLHQLHEDWLIHEKKFSSPSNLLVIDANDELDQMKQVFEDNRDKIMCNA